MKIFRAILTAIVMYVLSVAVLMISSLILGGSISDLSLVSYMVYWVVIIPIVLVAAKWYFKAIAPSFARGFFLGIVFILVGFLLDVTWLYAVDQLEGLKVLYSDWRLYLTLFEVLALASYAGFEFDGTFSAPVKGEME